MWEDYGISLCKPWVNGDFKLETVPDSALAKWKDAVNYLGYRFYMTNNRTTVKDGKLNVYFQMGNRSYSPLYDDFWNPQFVIRNAKDNQLVKVMDATDYVNLKSLPCKKSTLNYEIMVRTSRALGDLPANCNVYFRVIDKCHINENMYLDNEGRTEQGEYLLFPAQGSTKY